MKGLERVGRLVGGEERRGGGGNGPAQFTWLEGEGREWKACQRREEALARLLRWWWWLGRVLFSLVFGGVNACGKEK